MLHLYLHHVILYCTILYHTTPHDTTLYFNFGVFWAESKCTTVLVLSLILNSVNLGKIYERQIFHKKNLKGVSLGIFFLGGKKLFSDVDQIYMICQKGQD